MGKNSSKLSPQTIQDLKSRTDFTNEEIHKWYKVFMKEIPNGKVTLHEFQNIYSQIFPLGDSSLFSAQAFKVLDANHDGTIDFREFLCALNLSKAGHSDEKLLWAFKMYDADGDGFISKTEMKEISEALYKMMTPKSCYDEKHQKKAENIFKMLDANNDGRISFDEFIEGAQKDPWMKDLISFGGAIL